MAKLWLAAPAPGLAGMPASQTTPAPDVATQLEVSLGLTSRRTFASRPEARSRPGLPFRTCTAADRRSPCPETVSIVASGVRLVGMKLPGRQSQDPKEHR
jgi:hypothetical protein